MEGVPPSLVGVGLPSTLAPFSDGMSFAEHMKAAATGQPSSVLFSEQTGSPSNSMGLRRLADELNSADRIVRDMQAGLEAGFARKAQDTGGNPLQSVSGKSNSAAELLQALNLTGHGSLPGPGGQSLSPQTKTLGSSSGASGSGGNDPMMRTYADTVRQSQEAQVKIFDWTQTKAREHLQSAYQIYIYQSLNTWRSSIAGAGIDLTKQFSSLFRSLSSGS